jgi:hypothetical protein
MTPTERRARLKRLKVELSELTNDELAELLHPEIDRRSLGANGAPKRDGLRWALTNGLLALLDLPTSTDPDTAAREAAMVDRIDAVGRGAVVVREHDATARVRWLEERIAVMLKRETTRHVGEQEMLARTIESEWAELAPIDRSKLKAAFSKRSRGDRLLAAVARAAGIVRAVSDDAAYELIKSRRR